MKTTHRNSVIAIALFLFLWTVPPASAFYSPGAQRWVNRDPAGEDEGEPNLFVMVRNAPVVSVDSFGEEIFSQNTVNCLGFAIDFGYGISPSPGRESLKQLLEKYGWTCKGPTGRKCKGKRDEKVIVVYIYDTSGFPNGADPFPSTWPTSGSSDFHSIKKCDDGKWRFIPNNKCPIGTPGILAPNPRNPDSYYTGKNEKIPKQRYCCTK
jgi:hypothetical protein